MPLAPDMLAAIGAPPHRSTPYTDAEIGWMMKCKARELIDSGEIKTKEEAKERFMIRGRWIADMNEIDETTRIYWIKFEEKFYYSALKYFQ